MAWSSSMTAFASAVDNSFGSRRPDDDRQWMQARLHPYVSSHVRQMGASKPPFSCSTSALATAADDLGVRKRGQRLAQRWPPTLLDAARAQRIVDRRMLIERPDERHEIGRAQEREAPVAVVV